MLAYLAPAIIGIALVFFMIKPVLARPGKRQDPVPILPANEPVLFAFIEQLCRQIRAPVPRRVQVDCQVNASASFPPGWLGIFRRKLVLTIGLRLVAGLSIRELGGVLAHEFGHFAQGGGMRLTADDRGRTMRPRRAVSRCERFRNHRADGLVVLGPAACGGHGGTSG